MGTIVIFLITIGLIVLLRSFLQVIHCLSSSGQLFVLILEQFNHLVQPLHAMGKGVVIVSVPTISAIDVVDIVGTISRIGTLAPS